MFMKTLKLTNPWNDNVYRRQEILTSLAYHMGPFLMKKRSHVEIQIYHTCETQCLVSLIILWEAAYSDHSSVSLTSSKAI